MFKLFKTNAGNFKVVNREIDTEGSIVEAVEAMVALGACSDDINRALHEMQANDHNYADFGINLDTGLPGLIFTARATMSYVNRLEAVFSTIPEQQLKAA